VNQRSIPLGCPLPNYRCLILDEFLQSLVINQEGELFIGGVGVFAGYLGRDDLTAKVLIQIDNEIFYRTGDLVRIDSDGLLHYIGRKDYQIKLHGQRIELGEIERCLLDTSISACVVIKWSEDHLVAYVQSPDIDEKQLREHCRSHLPPHMVPSVFIILEQLPLNANGKIDRKLLPPPDFSHLSSIHLRKDVKLLEPRNEIETNIHHIWCDIFQQNQISINTNIFTIGGHSLLLMRLFHQYKIKFHLERNTLSIADLFQHPTIMEHAHLIHQGISNTQNIDDYYWSSLHLTQGKHSFL
jgi:tyrocidine synthetase-3